MSGAHRIFDSRRLLAVMGLLLTLGFFATTISSYYVSRQAIRAAILDQELPLASSNIYSEIQKDLVQPVLISSTMAADTFLRDWVLAGEKNPDQMARYLREVKQRYGAFSSFFVSERSAAYFTGDGVLKHVSPQEPRDAWYYRVRDMKERYEINVDPDMANKDALTIFINYRVFDYSGNYIGATGIGLTVDAVRHLLNEYQERYSRSIYFVDAQGRIVLFGNQSRRAQVDLHAEEGLGGIVDRVMQAKSGGYQYRGGGKNHLLNVHYVPELKWFLFVEKDEDEALAEIRRTLYINLSVCLVVTLVVMLLMHVSLRRYQRRIEEMAVTDKLTGLLNRQAFAILIDKLLAENRREPQPIAILLADVDHFKRINDQRGHQAGDQVLRQMAAALRAGLRESDIAVRWGGEEFLVVLRGCDLAEAQRIAEKLRQTVEDTKFGIDGGDARMSLSIGVSRYDSAEPPEQAIARADAALYAAKGAGRNRVVVRESAV